MNKFRCGYIAIVGRPNVGKSTLMNHLLGQKISITSRKPQTTRHRILGIKTTCDTQYIYVDTPGMHSQEKYNMNRYMNRAAKTSVEFVNVILLVIEAGNWTEADDHALDNLRQQNSPVILVINKIDAMKNKDALLPFIQEVSGKYDFEDILPVSALKFDNLDKLETIIREKLDVSEAIYPEDQITDRNMKFLAAEIIREKLMRKLGQELPYDLTVYIEKFDASDKLFKIYAQIIVNRENQKPIIIGNKGQQLKNIGKNAREDMEKLFDKKVYLELWVKVKSGWADDERALQELGYTQDLEN